MYADLLCVLDASKMLFNAVPSEEKYGASIVYNSQVLSVHNAQSTLQFPLLR
jgi:hypothetical protein